MPLTHTLPSHLPCCCCCCSVTKLCLTLCNSMSAACQASLSITSSGSLLKLMSTELVILSNHPILPFAAPFSSCPQSFPALGSFPVSQLFASSGHSIGASASASASVLPMNIQDCFPLGLTGLIKLFAVQGTVKNLL